MSLAKKLLFKKGCRYAVVNAPEGFSLPREQLPPEAVESEEGPYGFLLLFARSVDELEKHGPAAVSKLEEDGLFWVAYPKKSSKLHTDLSRDSGWDVLNDRDYVGVSLIAMDDDWSAMRLRNRKYTTRK